MNQGFYKSVYTHGIFLLIAGCFAATPSLADGYDIISCNNGSARIQVDSGERTQVQFLSTNWDANEHLFRKLGASADFMSGPQYGLRAIHQNGIFSSSDFRGATREYNWTHNTYPLLKNGEYVIGYREYFSFFRVPGDSRKIRVQITRNDVVKCIDNRYNGRTGRCASGTYRVDSEYVGDWIFTDCQSLH